MGSTKVRLFASLNTVSATEGHKNANAQVFLEMLDVHLMFLQTSL